MLEDLRGRDEPRRIATQDGVGPGHDEGRRHALVGDVADDDADPAVGELDEVVEVAADDAGRTVVGGDLPVGQVRQLARQELLLDELGDLELLLVALAGLDLGRLLPDELGDPDRRRGLRGESGEEPPVVGGVLLLGQARAQVERPDELALADEGDDEHDAGVAELVDRRRVELEVREVDRTRRGLEIGEERVCRAMSTSGPGRTVVAAGRRAAAGALGGGRRREVERPADGLDECHDPFLGLQRPGFVTVIGAPRNQSATCVGGTDAADRRDEGGADLDRVDLVAEALGERIDRPVGVVAGPIEAVVDDRPGLAVGGAGTGRRRGAWSRRRPGSGPGSRRRARSGAGGRRRRRRQRARR